MARARNIKPSFFTNHKLAKCDFAARLLFSGLWTLADREGRLEDIPERIKVMVLPYDNVNCDELLSQLVEQGFIIRYIVAESNYIQIVNFVKHQNPHVKEGASTIPAPDKHHASPVQNVPYTESPIPYTESPILNPRPNNIFYEEYFDLFWQAYPKKEKREAAMSEFCRVVEMREATMDELRIKAKEYGECYPDAKYQLMPDKWLKEKRWKDEYSKPKPKTENLEENETWQALQTLKAKQQAKRLLK